MNRSGAISRAASADVNSCDLLVDEGARRRPSLGRLLGDVDRVLVGPGQEARVVPDHPVPARDHVGADHLVQRVQAGPVVGVGDRRGQVEAVGRRHGRPMVAGADGRPDRAPDVRRRSPPRCRRRRRRPHPRSGRPRRPRHRRRSRPHRGPPRPLGGLVGRVVGAVRHRRLDLVGRVLARLRTSEAKLRLARRAWPRCRRSRPRPSPPWSCRVAGLGGHVGRLGGDVADRRAGLLGRTLDRGTGLLGDVVGDRRDRLADRGHDRSEIASALLGTGVGVVASPRRAGGPRRVRGCRASRRRSGRLVVIVGVLRRSIGRLAHVLRDSRPGTRQTGRAAADATPARDRSAAISAGSGGPRSGASRRRRGRRPR